MRNHLPLEEVYNNWKIDSFEFVKYKKRHFKCICINCKTEKIFCGTELKQLKIKRCAKCYPRKTTTSPQTLKEGFEKFVVKKEGCWDWDGCCPPNPGYGQFRFGMKLERSHRASWIIHFGEIPKGLQVLHKCDNRHCSNPDHLFLGTQLDNVKDMNAKGRAAFQKNRGQ